MRNPSVVRVPLLLLLLVLSVITSSVVAANAPA